MKAAFMLQQVKGIDLDYDFSIYTYGPYSSEVTEDIDDLVSKQLAISTIYHHNSYVGYELKVSDKGNMYAEGLDRSSKKAIAEIVDFIKGKSAKELELYSTVIYIDRLYAKNNSWEKHSNSIVEKVHEIKPHFEEGTISRAFNMLQENGYLAS